MSPWLLLDVHYLCHRAFHSAKGMSWEGRPTGVIFGFLQSIGGLMDRFNTKDVFFCFESVRSLRKELYPDYKKKRTQRERTPEEQKAYKEFIQQIQLLRTELLPKIGFKNIYSFDGFESDDVLAMLGKQADRLQQDALIISADHDMYQCVSPYVHCYNPQAGQRMTPELFKKTYGIPPSRWALCKAIAGCNTDEVAGIQGVGEKTALKFLTEGLNPESKAFSSILSPEGKAIVRRNRKLVELPFDGCPEPAILKDHVKEKNWKEVCLQFGMRSLVCKAPIPMRGYASK